MCLLQMWYWMSLLSVTALLLSMLMVTVDLIGRHSLAISWISQFECLQASEIAMYSPSSVESATDGCLLDVRLVAAPPSLYTIPLKDFQFRIF